MNFTERHSITKLKSWLKYKELELNDKTIYPLTYSACVDADSSIVENNSELYVECENGEVQIFPAYCKVEQIKIGGLSIEVLIKEITDDTELKSYQSLAGYHYKNKDLFGRTSILVAVSTTPYLPKVLGYIEIATPFYVNKPRARVLNTPFKHNGISWNSWDKDTTKKYINTIVRIARCVVYPEFRGVGLGKSLIDHAEAFAKSRWQIKGMKPLFLEISADMLKYVPFAEKAGMHFIGETEGNLNRLHKDLAYLLNNYNRVKSKEIVSDHQIGIVEQQKSRLRKAIKLAAEKGLSIEEFIAKLQELNKEKRLKDFTFFNGLVSLPKPTYLKGLDEVTDKYIRANLESGSQEAKRPRNVVEKIKSPIILSEVNISYKSKIRRTNKTQAIYNAFGISPTDLETSVISNLTMTVQPGDVVLIIGPSGAGKTTLLNFLAQKLTKKNGAEISGSFSFPKNYQPNQFRKIRSQKSLIEYFGNEAIEYGLNLMGNVGLSDAFVFVKRFEELSKGQQYRAVLAKLIHDKCNVLIIDEFCSNLDPITANVLSYRFQRFARQYGITLFLAAPHCESFIKSLNPDQVIRLSSAWDYDIIAGAKFASHYPDKNLELTTPRLKVPEKIFGRLLRKSQRAILADSNSLISTGLVLAEVGSKTIPVYVTEVKGIALSELSRIDAINLGYDSLKSLREKFLSRNKIVGDVELKLLTFNLISF